MHLYGRRVFEQQDNAGRKSGSTRLRAAATLALALTTGLPAGFAQQADKAGSQLPAAPAPVPTAALNLRQAQRDFSKPAAEFWHNPQQMYRPVAVAPVNFANSVRMTDLVKDGKIYLSLSDAIALALENNYDIAIARYYLDIADTDVLRTKSGASFRGVGAGVLTNTIGGSSQTLSASGAPGGTSSGAAAGANGVTLTTDGIGPAPASLDPTLNGTIQFERQRAPQVSPFSGGSTNTNTYNFNYAQGFVTGTNLTVAFDNSRTSTSNGFTTYSPQIEAQFKATVTQHLLQGAGIYINKRYMYEAQLNRQITDSTFRQQILYTVNQVENIYWALVSSYEDVQAKQHALEQSTRLLNDNKKQLEIGTMAPLDVVNAESTVASDKQALLSSQNNLSYQQLVIKQAIARNLNDQTLISAPVVPTDRVSFEQLPEERQTAEELVQIAFQHRPELEQALLTVKKDAITLKGARNNLLPTFDVSGFYGATGLGGAQNPAAICNFGTGATCPANTYASVGYGTAFGRLFESKAPDKGVGFNLSIPIRNRAAQADQARSQIEYRQAELHLEQLYTQIHMQVVNALIALTNDRELVKSAQAARDYNQQSLDAEQKKLHLGASTTANVLQQQRNLATAENSLISAQATYAQARAGLYQMLASTLEHYGINLNDATVGTVKTAPVIPGLAQASK